MFDGVTPTIVAPGDSVSFQVVLVGAAPGVHGGVASFITNDADENPFSFNVTATVLGNTIIIDDGDPGYSDSANMQSWLQGFQSDVREAVMGGATQSAIYTFTGLPAGKYRVSATWTSFWNRATNAAYTINGGAPILINQKLDPKDAASTPTGTVIQVPGAGVFFADLDGAFVFAGGTLTVGLSDSGANGNVIMDAVRIERIGQVPVFMSMNRAATAVDAYFALPEATTYDRLNEPSAGPQAAPEAPSEASAATPRVTLRLDRRPEEEHALPGELEDLIDQLARDLNSMKPF